MSLVNEVGKLIVQGRCRPKKSGKENDYDQGDVKGKYKNSYLYLCE